MSNFAISYFYFVPITLQMFLTVFQSLFSFLKSFMWTTENTQKFFLLN